MPNTITDTELNVVQGFGERQLVRNTAATVLPGNILVLGTDNEWALGAVASAGLLAVAQNSSSNKDAKGTAYDFVGVDAKVIGIPLVSNAEVEFPDTLVDGAAVVATDIGKAVYGAADGKISLTDAGSSPLIGHITGKTTDGVTVLLG